MEVDLVHFATRLQTLRLRQSQTARFSGRTMASGISSRATSKAKALQTVIEESEGSTIKIKQYFEFKRKHGSSAVHKPVITKESIRILRGKIKSCSDIRNSVNIMMYCLDEFISNPSVVDPWVESCKDVVDVLKICLQYFFDANFEDSVKAFGKFCNILGTLGDQDKKLGSELYSSLAPQLMLLVLRKDVDYDMKAIILSCLSSACNRASQSSLDKTAQNLSPYLVFLAKIIQDLAVEAQMSAYLIFRNSLRTREQAVEKAQNWFREWPSLKDAFIESYSCNFSEGCAAFLQKLFELQQGREQLSKHSQATALFNKQDFSKAKLSTPHPNKKFLSAPNAFSSSSNKCEQNLVRGVKGQANSDQNAVKFALNESAATPMTPVREVFKKPFKTPYYPDRRKSLSLRQNEQKERSEGIPDVSEIVQGKMSDKSKSCASELKKEHLSNKSLYQSQENQASDLNARARKLCKSERFVEDSVCKSEAIVKVERWLKQSSNSPETPESLREGSRAERSQVLTSRPPLIDLDEVPQVIIKQEETGMLKSLTSKSGQNFVGHKVEEENKPIPASKDKSERSLVAPSSLKETGDIRKFTKYSEQKQRHTGLASPNVLQMRKNEILPPSSIVSTDTDNKPLLMRLTHATEKLSRAQVSKSTATPKMKEDLKNASARKQVNSSATKREKLVTSRLSLKESKHEEIKSPHMPKLEKNAKRSPSSEVNSDVPETTCKPHSLWEMKVQEFEKARRPETHSDDIYLFHENSKPTALKKSWKNRKTAAKKKSPPYKYPKNRNSPSRGRKHKNVTITKEKLGKKSPKVNQLLSESDIDENWFPPSDPQPKDYSLSLKKNVKDKLALKEENVSKKEKVVKLHPSLNKFAPPINSNFLIQRNLMVHTLDLQGVLKKTQEGKVDDCIRPPSNAYTDKCQVNQGIQKLRGTINVKRESASAGSSNTPKSQRLPEKANHMKTDRDHAEDKKNVQMMIYQRKKSINPTRLEEPTPQSERNLEELQLHSYSPPFNDSMINPQGEKQAVAIFGDSGVDVTSLSEIRSPPSEKVLVNLPAAPRESNSDVTEKQFRHHFNMKERLKNFLKCAQEANVGLRSGNIAISNKIEEIKGLADKIAMSAKHCISMSNDNQQKLSTQATALEGCSRHLGPYEDQTFKALIPATKYTDFKDFARRLRLQNTERVLKTIQTALENELTSDDSDEDQ